jgi:LexA DNA binding domain
MSSTAEDVHPGQPEPSPEGDLTERQRKVVQAIRDSIETCGYPPHPAAELAGPPQRGTV